MPLPVVKHAVVGELFDRMAMQQYALRYVDLVAATLKAQPAPPRRRATILPTSGKRLRRRTRTARGWMRHGILELENNLKEARRQVIVAEFAAHIDRTQIKQLQALLQRLQKTKGKESDEPTT